MEKKRKLSNKQQIHIIVGCTIFAILIIVLVVALKQKNSDEKIEKKYQVETVKLAEPLVFNGTVSASKTERFALDQSKGTLTGILVTNGQEIKANTPLLSYQNDTMQQQVDQEEQQVDKLSLAVTTAQQNLDSAYAKKQKLEENKKSAASANAQTKATTSTDTTGTDSNNVVATQNVTSPYDDAIEAQDEVIRQDQQALDAAKLDLTTMNQAIEADKAKVTVNVSATFDGIALVNENGKTESTTPIVQIVSKDTIIDGQVSEYDYAQVVKDKKVTILAANSDQEVGGTITEVSKLPDNNNASNSGLNGGTSQSASMTDYSFKVKSGQAMQYGYNCQITLPINELRIKRKSLLTDKIGQYVFVFDKGKVRKTRITAEKKNGLYVVTDGLKVNQKIISNPDKDLKDNKKVSVEK